MKAGWEVKPLGEIADFVMGQAPAGKDCNKDGIGTPFVKAGEFGLSRPVIREWTTDPKKHAKSTDVLICVVGATCGKINLGADCAIGRSAAAVRPDADQLDQFYLHYFLEGKVQEFREGSLGAAQTVISKNMLAEMSIPAPPLEEQKRIVAVLDAAFEGLTRAKENSETNLQNARELFGAFLEELFLKHGEKWSAAPLQDTVTKECTLSYGIVQPGDDVEGGVPVVRPTDLGKPLIAKAGLKTIAPDRADGYARTQLVGDEILLCVRGTTGVVAKALPELKGGNVTRGIVPIRFDPEKMLQDFGYYQFRSRHIQEQIEAQTYGAALRQINIRDLRRLSFVFPNVKEQEELLPMLQDAQRNCEALIEASTTKLTDIADLRQSLLQKAFAGELT